MQSLARLRSKLQGNAFTKTDAGYDAAKRGKGTTPLHDRLPVIAVQVRSANDVAYAIDFARSNGFDFSLRSGGHDMLGASTSVSGVLVDLSLMDSVDLNPATGLVRVEAGARSGLVTAAGKAHGFAPILGMSPHVGIGGLTLGGGIGWLSGNHGATVDHLVAAELVDANGRIIQADAQNDPDLFWAIRGGGGNFGAATAFTFQMQPVKEVLAGQLSLRIKPIRFLRFLSEFLAESGDCLDIEASFTPRSEVVDIRLCWSGDAEGGERMLRPLRNFAPIARDAVKPQYFCDFANDEPQVDNMFVRGGEFTRLSDDVADTLASILSEEASDGCSIGILHYMHGALCRPLTDTPFIRTRGHVLYNVAASWQGANFQPEKVSWATAAHQKLSHFRAPATYINYLCDDDDVAVSNTYGKHMERLRSIKSRYDPDNAFIYNRNITPSIPIKAR